ncbi:MAG: hypothetical protein ACRENA_07100 [Vulcanimicrobiaceae bacterium]
MSGYSIEPAQTEEEAAAIIAVLDSLRQEKEPPLSAASKWKMAGRPSTMALRADARDKFDEDP